uniref:ARID DNA-binding domain-containing protein n=1 Tax=Tanacetum cinerariifolium TaxID=118510 RepID=A0A6L2MQX4_TANCI|nr:ARID DNA-binding domain-containing protein [Tanacetum cinerariifolium]
MLVKKIKEVEAFNASKMSAKTRDHGKKIASNQKEKRARCYICKERGQVFWKYDATWEEVWYVTSAYKNHMCPTRSLFKKLKYKFKMIEKEETEKKFIFSYGVGNVTVEAREGNFVIPNVHYTPEVTLNVLSFHLLEEQWYTVKIRSHKCNLHYMYDEARTRKAQEESFTKDDGLKDAVTEHNKFLDEYFESIDLKEECSLTIVNLQGLTKDDGEAMNGCYKKFIDMVQVYYETAKMPWYENKPKEDVVESSSGNARVKDPTAKKRMMLE